MAVPADRVIVALDVPPERGRELAAALRPLGIAWFKVGLAAWISGGRALVNDLRALGARVFLDLKLHDIPHQVGLAAEAAGELGVELLTVHVAGGRAMLAAAVEGARGRVDLLGITVLTSLAAEPGQVLARARLARESGLGGVVCSPLEVAELRTDLPGAFRLVTPGIRPAGTATGDQQRVATPEQAIAAGSDLLVIGRPITGAADPVAAARAIVGS